MTEIDPEAGAKLYAAVERIVDEPGTIIERVERFEAELDEAHPELEDGELIEQVAEKLIRYFANRTATVGGLAAAPALLPGIGSIVALIGGGLVDMSFCLKYEVELVLSLSFLYGYDIRDNVERSRAFLLASVSTYSLLDSDRGIVKDAVRAVNDVAQAEAIAVFRYTPRQVGKMLTKIFAKLAIQGLSKSLVKAMPVIGIGISAAGNKFLTTQVGEQARHALRYRVMSEV